MQFGTRLTTSSLSLEIRCLPEQREQIFQSVFSPGRSPCPEEYHLHRLDDPGFAPFERFLQNETLRK